MKNGLLHHDRYATDSVEELIAIAKKNMSFT